MTKAMVSALLATAAAALLSGCASDSSAPNALSAGTPVAAAEIASAPAPAATIDNFMLSDTDYMGHELYRMTDARAIVIVTTGNGCPIARNLAPQLKTLKARYGGQGVQFLLLNSNLQDGRDAIAREKEEFGIDIPILMDSNQLVGEQLGVTRTAEFFRKDDTTAGAFVSVGTGNYGSDRDLNYMRFRARGSWDESGEDFRVGSVTVDQIPEPATLGLLGGAASLLLARRARRRG